MSNPRPLRFGRVEIWPLDRQLRVDGQGASVGSRAFDLLLALAERPGQLLTKNELLDLVWPNTVVEENNLQVQISTLRRVLGPDVIATIPGRGYRFCLAPEAAAPAAQAEVPALGPALERAAPDPAGVGQADTPSQPAGPAATPSMAGMAAAAPSAEIDHGAMAGNLPVQRQRPIGRDAELLALQALVTAHPLVTVVGAGGMGKTTLALVAAAGLRGHFADGAWLVELAPVTDLTQLVPAITQTLRITPAGPGTPAQQLTSALRTRELLLVLDNCEQLIGSVGALVAELLVSAPQLRVLVTSQEPLQVASEHLLRVEPLGLPGDGEQPSVDAHGAVALFVARASAVDPHFALNASNAAAVAELCRRLDGMPLAIELAAARVRLLGVHGLRERIGERFRVLTGGARTALPRHQTLAAMLEWSHSLLGPDEQVVLRRLGVFVGGFPLELAQRVATDAQHDEWAVLDALGVLVAKSLVAADDADPPRYRLLESTRAFALDRLHRAGETEALRGRHASALRDLCVQTDEARYGENGRLGISAFMGRLVPELDNWRAACEWAAGDTGDAATAVALAGSGALVLRYLGQGQEGLVRVRKLLARVDDRVEPLRAAWMLSRLAVLGGNGRMPRAELLEAAERAVRLCRGIDGARRALHNALCCLAWTRNLLGDSDTATALVPEAVALERDTDPAWVRSWRLNTQSAIESYQGRFDQAAATLAEERSLLEQTPGEGIALFACRCNLAIALNSAGRHSDALVMAGEALRNSGAHANRGQVLFQLLHAQVELGRLDDATRTMVEALPVWRRDGLLLYGAAELAALMARHSRWDDAARLDGASERYVRDSGVRHHHLFLAVRQRMLDEFSAAGLEPAALERWRREGAAMDEEQLAVLCVAAQPPTSNP